MSVSKGVGRGRKGIKRGKVREYGQWVDPDSPTKLCKGPLHPDGKKLPRNTNFFLRQDGYLTAPCKQCRRYKENKDKNRKNFGYVRISRVWFIFLELEKRIGRRETERRLGYGTHKMSRILGKKQRYIEKETLKKAINLLRELRETGEQRTEKDIKYGRHARLTRDDKSAKLAS